MKLKKEMKEGVIPCQAVLGASWTAQRVEGKSTLRHSGRLRLCGLGALERSVRAQPSRPPYSAAKRAASRRVYSESGTGYRTQV